MENKVICCCHNVKMEDIKKAVDEGVSTFEELQEKTKIGTDCPPCAENAQKVFDKLSNKECCCKK